MTYKEFDEIKRRFFKKHHNDFGTYTSPMNSYGEYHKDYIFTDGAQWTETMRPVFRDVPITVENVGITVNVKLLETEAWNTEDSRSIYYYERFNHTQEAAI